MAAHALERGVAAEMRLTQTYTHAAHTHICRTSARRPFARYPSHADPPAHLHTALLPGPRTYARKLRGSPKVALTCTGGRSAAKLHVLLLELKLSCLKIGSILMLIVALHGCSKLRRVSGCLQHADH